MAKWRLFYVLRYTSFSQSLFFFEYDPYQSINKVHAKQIYITKTKSLLIENHHNSIALIYCLWYKFSEVSLKLLHMYTAPEVPTHSNISKNCSRAVKPYTDRKKDKAGHR